MIRRALPWLLESGSDRREGSEREVDLPLDWSEEVDLPLDGSDREVGCGLDRESRVERGKEEEKAVGVAEGCLVVVTIRIGKFMKVVTLGWMRGVLGGKHARPHCKSMRTSPC